ncbi:MAG: dihydroorotase [Chloroflexi bacterium]|nr:dihydroorotase [Chloroflexota bacterium]
MATGTSLLITSGRILDPSQGLELAGDLFIQAGQVAWTAPAGQRAPEGQYATLDARGLVVSPGFIDLHCHLREPGYEDKETIATGTLAAARGGFTTVCAMPNTEPPLDTAASVEYLLRKAQQEGHVRVLPVGCITRGRKGKQLVEMAELAAAGVVGFSDDGDPVADAYIMRMALTYGVPFGLPVINHCQDPALSRIGAMHEGWTASRLGLKGIPAEAEEVMAARDIELAALTGGWLHLAHISTAGALELVRRARERGLRVTAEVTPHHLVLTDEWVMGLRGEGGSFGFAQERPFDPLTLAAYDTNAKVNPPLRTRRDTSALLQGLKEGVIDAIATDHAPHTAVDKTCTFDEAAFGISGLETAFGLLMALVHRGDLSLATLIERLTVGPARLLGARGQLLGSLQAGAQGDVAVLDPDAEWVVDPQGFASKGKNTPLAGARLKGKVMATVVGGRVVYQDKLAKAPG